MADPLWEGVREGCGSCAFGKRSEYNGNGRIYVSIECRRYPPQMVQAIERVPYGTLQYEVQAHHPSRLEDDWCGEYKRKGTA